VNNVPPQALEAEETVLGATMVSGNVLPVIVDVLEPRDFYRESHGKIYRGALALYARSEPVDAITLSDELEQQGTLEEVGGKVRVFELASLAPATANVKHYAEIVKEKAGLRDLIDAGKRIEKLGWDGTEDGLEQADLIVQELAPRHTSHTTVYDAEGVVAGFRERVAIGSKGVDNSGVPAPFSFLPRLKGSRLYVVAGYTADGKTALGLQFFSAGCDSSSRGMLVTNEMSEGDLTARLVAQAGIPHHQCESGQIEAQHKETMEARLAQIGGWEFRLIDDEGIDLPGIRRQVRLYRPDFLIIDHLHRFKWKERRDLEATVVGITDLAKEYEIPVILLAQLNRSNWQDPFPRPSLVRLRETAVLEQEAWNVWFIWRPRDSNYEPGEHAEFMVAKSRSGPLFFENLEFQSQYVRFDEKPKSMVPVTEPGKDDIPF